MGTFRAESATPAPVNTKANHNISNGIGEKFDELAEEILTEIRNQLGQIQYGSLEIQVHNGHVVQIERREKKRWEKGVKAR